MERVINKKIIQKVEQNGRITFPADFRERFEILKGDYVEITINKIIRYDEVSA
ncbi:MAG: AbrB/MazE/SpoVT family DNA-binding domain-containing protein [Ferroplasma sp.]|uniref:AbrB/MazE/SpoVT family DNA-binding domain-containing protein n=1 Tax=Ferroplasma sp. TaxID=2591003 RepID=UPI002816045D|nr:AbrB/MazE/SpoVT family DNA-binding domain-containing protein [Ferroplasma sp.]WMT51835.1 MAG: AbrB/MazE/SpoVT family DNA-binding domain-containing protein [Ferroplasma sp.]